MEIDLCNGFYFAPAVALRLRQLRMDILKCDLFRELEYMNRLSVLFFFFAFFSVCK